MARGDVELIWLGAARDDLGPARIVPTFARLPYPMLDTVAAAPLIHRLGADAMHFAGNTGWSRRTAVPTLLTVHDLIFMRSEGGSLRQRLGHRYERHVVPRSVRAATAVVAVSQATADECALRGMA